MAIIRMTHVADLPAPEDLRRRLDDAMPKGGPPRFPLTPPPGGGAPQATLRGAPSGSAQPAQATESALAQFPTFDHVVDLIRANRDMQLLIQVESYLRLAAYRPGRIELTPTPDAPADLPARLGARLQGWTGTRWAVTVVNTATTATIAEARDADISRLRAAATQHPLVQSVLAAFPRARITAIHTPAAQAEAASLQALPPVEDEWDPFEDG
jgi:DNA polymerase-3 subunit gamma/tau